MCTSSRRGQTLSLWFAGFVSFSLALPGLARVAVGTGADCGQAIPVDQELPFCVLGAKGTKVWTLAVQEGLALGDASNPAAKWHIGAGTVGLNWESDYATFQSAYRAAEYGAGTNGGLTYRDMVGYSDAIVEKAECYETWTLVDDNLVRTSAGTVVLLGNHFPSTDCGWHVSFPDCPGGCVVFGDTGYAESPCYLTPYWSVVLVGAPLQGLQPASSGSLIQVVEGVLFPIGILSSIQAMSATCILTWE